MKYLNLKLPKIGFKIGSYENVSFADEKKLKKDLNLIGIITQFTNLEL